MAVQVISFGSELHCVTNSTKKQGAEVSIWPAKGIAQSVDVAGLVCEARLRMEQVGGAIAKVVIQHRRGPGFPAALLLPSCRCLILS